MKEKKVNKAIEQLDIMINDVERLILSKEDFIGFLIIAIGIELLGSFSDAEPFSKYGLSDKRFKNGMKYFNQKQYKAKITFMFEHFRGSLIHQYRPSNNILLTSKCKNAATLKMHLTETDNKTVFVLEQLLNDFTNAVASFKNELKKPTNSLNKAKIYEEYMHVLDIKDSDSLWQGNSSFFEASGVVTVGNTKPFLIKSKK